MSELAVGIITFILGFFSKKLFDNRDLRRNILEPVFLEFEEIVIYLQHQWRDKQRTNVNAKDFDAYSTEYNGARDRLIRMKHNLVYACKKIREEELANLVNNAFDKLIQAISSYGFFMEYRDKTPPDQRRDLVAALEEANKTFDECLPAAMESVYSRYWILISGVLVSGPIFNFIVRLESSCYRKKI